MELGLATFGDVHPGTTPERRMRELLEEMKLADELGLDVFAIGEHHRPDYAVSSPAVVLGAGAAVTERIRLSSAVSVLSSDDPVRVFERFSTVDALSQGRAEVLVGRGSFTESFPLFGQDLKDYDDLYSEKLALLLAIREQVHVTWSGRHRPALDGQGVYPRPVQDPLPVWIAVGGSPESVVRAGTLGLPLTIAIIGGQPERFVPLVELYREAASRAGHDPATLPLAINTHAFIGATVEEADAAFMRTYLEVMNRIGRERGWPAMTRAQFDALCAPRGALLVGSPAEVVEKILFAHELFGHQRFLAQISVGPLPHANVMRAIELFGTVVAPAVRKALGPAPAAAPPAS